MKHIKNYFESKFSRQCEVTETACSGFLKNIQLPCLTKEQAVQCDGPLTITEIFNALKQMINGKSPGNDGLSKEFYIHFFGILGQNLADCLNWCYNNKSLTESQSQALITLIQKPGKDTRLLNSWRPISLINVDAKIISKILAKH